MFVLTFVCLSLWTVSNAATPVDNLVDEIIYEIEQQMIVQSQTFVKVPDVSETFSKKVLFFTVEGSIATSGGRVGNLSSIYRVGDVVITENNATDTMSIQGSFAMKDLTMNADSLEFKLKPLDINKPLSVSILTNAATFKASLTFGDNVKCTSRLDDVRVTQLGDFLVSYGGSGVLSEITDTIIGFVTDKLAPKIQDGINAQLYPIISSAMQKIDLCSKLHF